MSEEAPPPKRVRLSKEDFDSLSKEDLFRRWNQQESYVAALESKSSEKDSNDELMGLRESEEKLKQQQIEATRRENILVMRLTTKEQEMQDFANQIAELKQAQTQSTAQLRSLLLDPAINLLFQRMRSEMDATKEKLEQTQNDLAAWKFTPDSQTGKRLMAKCRMLLTENEELGKVISSGRMAKLEGEIALEKTLVQEMKKSQEETDEFLVELDEDQEGMQTTIYLLQQQLKDCKEQMQQLQQHNQQLQQLANEAAASSSDAVASSLASSNQQLTQQTVTNKSAAETTTHEVASNLSYFSNHTQSSNHGNPADSRATPPAGGGGSNASVEGEVRTGTSREHGSQQSVSAPDLFSPSSPSPAPMDTSSSATTMPTAGSSDLMRTAGLVTHNNSNSHLSDYTIHSNANTNTTTNSSNDSSTNYHQRHQSPPLPPQDDATEEPMPSQRHHALTSETNGTDDHISEEMAEDSQTPEMEVESCEDTTAEEESESSMTPTHHPETNVIVTATAHKVNNHTLSSSSPVSTSAGGGGGVTMESTDASSDAWSPPPAASSKHIVDGLDEDSSDHMVSDQSSHTTEEIKSRHPPEILLPNGLDDIPQSTSEDET